MSKPTILILLCCTLAFSAGAQERRLVRKGNELYAQGKYAEAATAYQQAEQKSPTFTPGAFNLGNAYIQQKQYEAARRAMANAAKTAKDPQVQSGAQYNTGNTWMTEQQWQKALDAYKAALRKNPADADARYNYSYALAKLRQQQQQDQKKNGGGNNNDKKDDQSKDEGKKDQQKQDQQNDSKQSQRPSQQQRPQPQPSKLSEQQADNLLKALQQDERKVQDKLQQGKASPVKMEKDW